MNEYGLNADYLTMNFRVLLRDINRYTPDEMHLELIRLAGTIRPVLPDNWQDRAIRQYRHNGGSGGFVFAYDKDFIDAMLKGEK